MLASMKTYQKLYITFLRLSTKRDFSKQGHGRHCREYSQFQ